MTNDQTKLTRRKACRRQRSGMALVLVICVLAAASILAYAMLSVNMLQAEASSNLMQSAGSEYIAESGIDVGMYYLQWPSLAPSAWTNTAGYKLYATAVPLNDGTTAAFEMEVRTNAGRDSYTIQSTGMPSTGSSFGHTATATVTVTRVKIPAAGMFGGNILIPARTTFSNAGVSGIAGVQANGIVNVSGTLNGGKLQSPLAAGSYVVPTATNVNYYGVGMTGGTYLWIDGVTLGTPQLISVATLTSAKLPAVAANNPAAIFYHDGNLAVSGSITIPGTLIVRGGTLTFSGIGSAATINPVGLFPALVCEKSAAISGKSFVLTANGVVFLGGGFAWTGASNTNSKCIIKGALVMPSGTMIGASATGSLSVTYTASKIDVPALATFDQAAVSVQATSWNQ